MSRYGGKWGTRYARNRARRAFSNEWRKMKRQAKKNENESEITLGEFFAILFLIALIFGVLTNDMH